MSDLGNIVKKEVKELLTIKTLIPVIALALIFGFLGQSFGGETEEKPVVGIVDGDNSALSRDFVEIFENRSKVVYFSSDVSKVQEGLARLKENQGDALLKIPPNLGDNIRENRPGNIEVWWILKGVGVMESVPTEIVNGLINTASKKISGTLIQKSGELDPKMALRPIRTSQTTLMKGNKLKGVSPGNISQALYTLSTLIPMVLFTPIVSRGIAV